MNKETKEALEIIKNSPEIKRDIKFTGALLGLVFLVGLAAIKW